MKRVICVLLIFISFISMIFSAKAISMEQVFININCFNRGIFKKAIEGDKIENIDSIRKISLGRGWHSGDLCIYYYNKPKFKETISEGNFKFSKTIRYINSWGISLDIYGLSGLAISFFCFIVAIIVLVKWKNDKNTVWLVVSLIINLGTLLKLLTVIY